MQITNGSVSRTYKPADYEGRTVGLSFSFEPGDDVDAATAFVVAICERQARGIVGTEIAEAPKPATRTRATRPAVVETVSRVEAPAAEADTRPTEFAPTARARTDHRSA